MELKDKHIRFEVTSSEIPHTRFSRRTVWFLDEIVKTPEGKNCRINIVNGTKDYCYRKWNELLAKDKNND